MADVAVIGGGVSGLSAAYELMRRGVTFELFEQAPVCGGVVVTDTVAGYTIDAGPDSLLTQKPAAIALCGELGLTARLQGLQTRETHVLRGGRLRQLPPTSVFGLPTRWLPFVTTDAFSWPAKLRMAAEVAVPPRHDEAAEDDESIASFMARRFGQASVDSLAEPLLAGIHGGDPERLSMRSGFPRLVDLESRYGSVIAGLRRMPHQSTASPFVSLPEGMAGFTAAIARALPPRSVHVNARIERIRPAAGGYLLEPAGGGKLHLAHAVVLCTPPAATAQLLGGIDANLAALCGRVSSTSAVTVALGFARSAVRHPLNGTGFVVPRSEGISLRAVSWVSSKWDHRAPAGKVLLRAYLGGAGDPTAIDRSAADLAGIVHRELTGILHLVDEPELARVYPWRGATPQIEVGHAALMRTIDQALDRHPGLFVSASGFRGTGIPDCVADARRQAGVAAAALVPAVST
jgi:oxygen-dependent protoporphyrinogen oxidase